MSFLELLGDQRLTRLLRIRWIGQLTDGIFQSALASFLLFSPERQASAASAAIAFTVVLLPYSIVGPFVGTLLDRISRKRVIFCANILRSGVLVLTALLVSQGRTGIELTTFVLIAFGLNRLILAGLSAGLPLVINHLSLISANAIAVTGGSVLVVIGGGIGVGVRKLFNNFAGANLADASLILIAAAGYLIAALFTLALKRKEIGPQDPEIIPGGFTQRLKEMKDGFQFLVIHGDAARGIIATAVHRGGITALTLMVLLLERNTFNNPSDSEAGLAGLGVMLSIAAVGFIIGAVIAPYGVKRFGRYKWIRLAMLCASIGPLFLIFSRSQIMLAFAGFLIAMCGQSVKVANDALVQSKIEDVYRGRIFSVYDVLVNGTIIVGALLAAIVLPASGDTYVLPLIIFGGYLATGGYLLRPKAFAVKL